MRDRIAGSLIVGGSFFALVTFVWVAMQVLPRDVLIIGTIAIWLAAVVFLIDYARELAKKEKR